MRDMTERQFKDALARRGYVISPLGLHIYNHELGAAAPLVFKQNKRGYTDVDFRASLARAIQMFTKLEKKRREQPQ